MYHILLTIYIHVYTYIYHIYMSTVVSEKIRPLIVLGVELKKYPNKPLEGEPKIKHIL
jgi:hypothetical protein